MAPDECMRRAKAIKPSAYPKADFMAEDVTALKEAIADDAWEVFLSDFELEKGRARRHRLEKNVLDRNVALMEKINEAKALKAEVIRLQQEIEDMKKREAERLKKAPKTPKVQKPF